MKKSSVSIKDIARLSGVSVSTVSRVLNNTGRFSENTSKKVLSIAKKYNYRQNIIAQGMRRGSLSIVGVLVPDITNAYYATIVKKCEQYFFKLGYLTIVCNTDRNPELEKKYMKQLGNHIVDGLIVISTQSRISPKDRSLSIPTVFIDRFPKLADNIVITSSDNYTGALLATNHLLDHNAYPVMVTTKTSSFSSNQKRIKGFQDTIINRGIKNPQIITLPTHSDSIYKARNFLISKLFNLLDNHKKVGIFAVNDNVGAFIYQIAKEKDISVPSQLSIVGFDDSSIAKEMQLTTIHQDTDKLAKTSCNNLIKLLKNDEIFERNITIPVSLIKRKTT